VRAMKKARKIKEITFQREVKVSMESGVGVVDDGSEEPMMFEALYAEVVIPGFSAPVVEVHVGDIKHVRKIEVFEVDCKWIRTYLYK